MRSCLKYTTGPLLVLAAFCACSLFAAPHEDAGANGYDFLHLGAGAQPASMAGAYTGSSGDIYSLYWNPAGVASMNRTMVMADYLKYVLDIHRGMLAGVLDPSKVRNLGTVGGYLNYLYAGSFEAVDEAGNALPSGNFTAGYYETGLTFARMLPQAVPGLALSAGGTLKYLRERIDDYASNAGAVDLGIHCILPGNRIKAGFSVRNLGLVFGGGGNPPSLPLIYAAGILFHSTAWPKSRFALDLSKPAYGYYTVRLGMEYRVNRDFFLRGGYRFLENEVRHWYHLVTNVADDYVREDFNTWSAGAGLKLSRQLTLDLAVTGASYQSVPLIGSTLLYQFR